MTGVFESATLQEDLTDVHFSEHRFRLGEEFVSDVRIFRLKGFPYFLFYWQLLGETVITIYPVAHRGRRSAYWRERI